MDGFAGPGEYEDGERGSPLIALNAVLNHQHPPTGAEVQFVFIEKDKERAAHLQSLLDAKAEELPNYVQYRVICGEFDSKLGELLTSIEAGGHRLAPTFAFIDPFGYSGIPMETIARLMRHDKCEVLINFMFEEVNRFLAYDNDSHGATLDRLFGTGEWREIIAQPLAPAQREKRLHDLYQRQLRISGGATYVRSFKMRNKRNKTDYYLFFGTRSLKGMDRMKQAMWRVDPTGAYEFSDLTDSQQQVLFQPEPDYTLLRKMLQGHFHGKTATVQEIEDYVIAETPFHSSQYKKTALKPMEQGGTIVPINPAVGRRAGTYADRSALFRFE